MDLGLAGKVGLVAAASKGLGYGVARALAREGARVSICARDETALRDAEARLRADTGAEVMSVPCDMKDAAAVEAWVARTAERWGRVDAVLVNAGGPPPSYFTDTTDAMWQAAFELTLMSAVRLIRAALPHMTEGGAILTITSGSVVIPIEQLALSTVMRLGVAGLVKTLAEELAPRGIRVNNLIPGRLDTDRVRFLDENRAKRQGITFEESRGAEVARIPLKRLGTTDEFGAAAAFLLSPAASYITGTSLRVDGGQIRSISG